jgi:hypothetical protein
MLYIVRVTVGGDWANVGVTFTTGSDVKRRIHVRRTDGNCACAVGTSDAAQLTQRRSIKGTSFLQLFLSSNRKIWVFFRFIPFGRRLRGSRGRSRRGGKEKGPFFCRKSNCGSSTWASQVIATPLLHSNLYSDPRSHPLTSYSCCFMLVGSGIGPSELTCETINPIRHFVRTHLTGERPTASTVPAQTQNHGKTRTYIHTYIHPTSEIWTHDPSVWEVEHNTRTGLWISTF